MQKKKRGSKYWVNQIHLWLGLVSGLVVFVVAVTGCIYVFQKEISEWVHSDRYFVTAPDNGHTLPVQVLFDKAKKAMGDTAEITYVVAYKAENRTWEFMSYADGDEKAFWIANTVKHYQSVFLNPYTGEKTGFVDYRTDFFNVVKYLHWSLLMNTAYGGVVVGWSTFIFVVMLITGLILWWPKKWSRAQTKQRFTINWKAKWRRVNYDMHNVLGFYAMIIAILIALTGMVMAFTWFRNTVYVVATQSVTPPATKEWKSVKPAQAQQGSPFDLAFTQTVAKYPQAERIGINTPYGEEGTIQTYCYRGGETYYDYDVMQFDRYNGKLLGIDLWKTKNRGEKLIGMNYDIHVGAVAGLPGKILAFLASLVAASLPVTGVMLWWGKRHKPSHRKDAATPAQQKADVEAAL